MRVARFLVENGWKFIKRWFTVVGGRVDYNRWFRASIVLSVAVDTG